jgi:predicted outer membrane repeat protein
VSGNSATTDYGGGIYNVGTLTANRSFVIFNRADVEGGGIYEASGSVSLTATLVLFNTPDNIYP